MFSFDRFYSGPKWSFCLAQKLIISLSIPFVLIVTYHSEPFFSRGRRHSTADDILEKLNKTKNVVDNINDRVSARLQKLKVFIAEVEDFQELIDNFEKWLKGTEKNLETFKVLPFTVKETKSVQENFQVC